MPREFLPAIRKLVGLHPKKREERIVDAAVEAMAEKEGFYVSEHGARQRGIRWPTLPQRNCNPVNIRHWRDKRNKPYPQTAGYLDLLAWAREKDPLAPEDVLRERALAEGWRIARRQIRLNIDRGLTLFEFFAGQRNKDGSVRIGGYAGFAPAKDGNDPLGYASFVAEAIAAELGEPVDIDTKLKDIVAGRKSG